MKNWPEYENIESHLRDQYKNIFTEKAIKAHLEEYISDSHTNYLIQKLLPFVPRENKILDIGSGYGEFVRKANQHGFDAYGIEIAEFEHKISQKIEQAEGLSLEKFTLGSALNLPYESESFDVITFWNVLEHVNDYQKALTEAIRVLKPDGKIFILAPNYCAFRKEAHYHVPWIPFFPKKLAGFYLRMLGRDPRFLYDSIFYISVRQVVSFLKKKGFTITTGINEKINMDYPIHSHFKQKIIKFAKRWNLMGLFNSIVFFLKTNPLSHSIDIIAKK
ncbi:MAG: class I SAM-dependent methyltransferase [Proteobacteria bacterium]|nr:class I SAM-dependent methyltransferase [Pseudomonadota bacterium]